MSSDQHPLGCLAGLAPLARLAFNGGDLTNTARALLERCNRNSRDANALMDLSTVLQLLGRRDSGLAVQEIALSIQQHYYVVRSIPQYKIRLLLIKSPGDLTRNNAVEFLVENLAVDLHLLYLTTDKPLPKEWPEHDLAMVAVCQSELNRPVLKHLASLAHSFPRPLLCSPEQIGRLSRDGACALLKDAPGVVMPLTVRIERQMLEAIGRRELRVSDFLTDGEFPVILRPVDSDKGFGLEKLESADAIPAYLDARPESNFYLARFVEYQSQDGQYRKVRIVLIDKRPYVCHLAISSNWMVHYMSAGMFESAEKRDEEARFFADFDSDFAWRHRDSMLAIGQRLSLEYVGIDCGETPDGQLLIFEVDSGMTVHSMDPPELFPYKERQMRKVFHAFQEMLVNANQRSVSENAA